MNDLNIVFIGGGNMAEALLSGLLRRGHAAEHIHVADPSEKRRALLARDYSVQVHADNGEAAACADVLLLAVKPQQMQTALKQLQPDRIRAESTLISIAAGISTARLREWLGDDRHIIRAMPNTPALVGAGISVLYGESDPEHRARAEYVLSSCGETVWVDTEHKMHAVTAVSGSGPAYFFLLAELMQATAESLGLDRDLAARLVTQTALGSGKMLVQSGRHAAELRQQVSSPGGTTMAALDVMYEMGLPEAVRQGIIAASRRSMELDS